MRPGAALLCALALSCKSEASDPPAPPSPCTTIACMTSGVPPEACAEGFRPDGEKGCSPVLPEEECEGNTYAVPGLESCVTTGVDVCGRGFAAKDDGCANSAPLDCENNTIAIPGDTKCEPIAPCGSERYPTTSSPAVYVDAAYTGTDSDGSADKPFAQLADALARVDATKRSIALAVGTYEFAARIAVPVEIVGACQERVFIVAPKTAAAPAITTAAAVTLKNVDVSGPLVGIEVTSGTTTLISSRVHDTLAEGILVGQSGSIELDRVVVSRATGAGVNVRSGVATIRNSNIRRTATLADLSGGVAVGGTTLTTKAPRITIENSVLSNNARYGVFARGAELTVRDSLVAATGEPKIEGAGIFAAAGRVPPKVVISGVLVESTVGIGIGAFDGTAEIDRTTVRGTRISRTGAYALEFGVDPDTRKPATVKVTRSHLTDSDDHGIFIKGASVDVGSTIVRSTREAADAISGRAVVLERSGEIVSTLTLHDSLIEDAVGAGVLVSSGTATLERVAIRGILPASDKRFGMGALAFIDTVPTRPTLVIRRSLIEGVHDAGVLSFGAHVELEGSVIRGVSAREESGFFGHGVHFSYDVEHQVAADGFVHGSFITDVHEAGINAFMSNVEVDATTIVDVRGDSRGLYGDGITVSSVNNDLHNPATLALHRTKIARVTRAAVSVFEADASVSGLLSLCNPIDIAIEKFVGKQVAKLSDGGENMCGCEVLAPCRAISASIEPLAR